MATIKINDRFEIHYDGNCWNLTEWRDGFRIVNKATMEKVPDKKPKVSYFPSLLQACHEILNRSPGEDVDTVNGLIKTLEGIRKSIETAIDNTNKPNRKVVQ